VVRPSAIDNTELGEQWTDLAWADTVVAATDAVVRVRENEEEAQQGSRESRDR
jgi:hypothetical protein